MNYGQAQRKSISKKLVGVFICVPAIVSTVVSFLKMAYYRLDDGSQIGGIISRPFKQFVAWVYDQTEYLNLFWEYSPTPNQMNIPDFQNLYFIGIYLTIFVGLAFYSSGKKLSRRLAEINEKIENQLVEESIKGGSGRTREQIEDETKIPTNSIFSQFHQLYLAPVITAVIVAILVKLLGL